MTKEEQFGRPTPQSPAEVGGHRSESADQHRIEAALKGVTRDLNSKSPPRHHNEGTPRFVELTDKLYDAAIEAGRRQVNRAENLLRQIEAEAEEARARAKARWDELQRLERDLEDMSSELLQSFARYNGEKR